jgi:hypothetical protein
MANSSCTSSSLPSPKSTKACSSRDTIPILLPSRAYPRSTTLVSLTSTLGRARSACPPGTRPRGGIATRVPLLVAPSTGEALPHVRAVLPMVSTTPRKSCAQQQTLHAGTGTCRQSQTYKLYVAPHPEQPAACAAVTVCQGKVLHAQQQLLAYRQQLPPKPSP